MFDWSRRNDRPMPGEPAQGLLDVAVERFGGLGTGVGAALAAVVLALVVG